MNLSMEKLLILACLLLGLVAHNAEARLVRGASLQKKRSSGVRALKMDKEEEPVEAAEGDKKGKDDEATEDTEEPTEEPTDEPKDEDTDAPETDGDGEGVETEEPSVVIEGGSEAPMINVTEDMDNVTIGMYKVPLAPFALVVTGTIAQEDLHLEDYLLGYMVEDLPNLVDISLESYVAEEEEDVGDVEVDNSTRRELRILQETIKYYFEGNATFDGPPVHSVETVDAALIMAINDTVALEAFLEANAPPNVTVSIDEVATGDEVQEEVDGMKGDETETTTDAATSEAEEESSDDGLSTTGLAIVIVAACVGGISLLIILMVGLTGPSGAAGGPKGGLPEQPLE